MARTDKIREFLNDNEGVIISGFANIFYYSGFTSEDATLVITKNRQILLTDSRYIVQARLQAKDFEVFDVATDTAKIIKDLPIDTLGFEENIVTISEFARLQKYEKKLVPMSQKLSYPRRFKSKDEILKISKAEELSCSALENVIKKMHTGMTEKEVAIELEYYMRKNGAEKTSFETIVASGVRSSMPHGVATEKLLEDGDFVTIDFGCVLDGYCSDMTRTFVMTKCSPVQKKVYDTVLKAQEEALSKIEIGKKCADIDKIARNIIEEAGYGENFGHSLGHSVGIEIHESPNFSPKSEDFIEKGNVITVEPGIYIENFGGVRIEDIVAIDDKVKNLTPFTKELIII